jgi:hypothetical protein
MFCTLHKDVAIVEVQLHSFFYFVTSGGWHHLRPLYPCNESRYPLVSKLCRPQRQYRLFAREKIFCAYRDSNFGPSFTNPSLHTECVTPVLFVMTYFLLCLLFPLKFPGSDSNWATDRYIARSFLSIHYSSCQSKEQSNNWLLCLTLSLKVCGRRRGMLYNQSVGRHVLLSITVRHVRTSAHGGEHCTLTGHIKPLQ